MATSIWRGGGWSERRAAPLLAALALLVLGWLPWRAGAQETVWERDGLDGRQVRAVALTPDGAGLVGLTGGARDPAFLWMRDAQGWSQPAVAMPAYVLALAAMPEGGVLLGTGRDISDQPGVFWVGGSPPGIKRLYDARAIGALAVAPGRGGSDVYAATAPWGGDREAGSELLRRDVSSGAWSTILRGSLACAETSSYFKQVVVAPSDPNRLFALEWCLAPTNRQTQLWRSDDRGQTWQVLPPAGLAYPLAGVLAIDPTDRDLLYLAPLVQTGASSAPNGCARSLDGGQTWSLKGDALDGLSGIRTLVVDPRVPQRVLAGTERGGVFETDDRGETWRALPGLEGSRVWSLAIDEVGGRLFAGTADGVWRTALP